MSKRVLITSTVCLAALLNSVCLAAEDSSDDAVAAAKAYVARLKAGGDVKAAVRDAWQADLLLQGSFGLMYAALPEDQRTRAQDAFAAYVAAPFANARLAEMF